MNVLKRQGQRLCMVAPRFSDMPSTGRTAAPPFWLNAHAEAVLAALETDAKKRDAYLKLAEGVHKRQSLLLSYNIGIETDQREREMNKRAARLVGLRLPTDVDETEDVTPGSNQGDDGADPEDNLPRKL